MIWFTQNWDRVLGIFLSIVVAGVVGFFAAIRTIDAEIASLQSRITRLETDSDNLVKPKLATIDENKLASHRIKEKLSLLERENEIQRATTNLLNLAREEARRNTLNELKEILNAKN